MSQSNTFEKPILGGTDGFRDEATLERGGGKMNRETIAGLSYALIRHQQELGVGGPIVVARDTRPSGLELSRASISGAVLAGAEEIIDCGIVPTPTAQKHAELVGAMATIVITASHNPEKYNGWKGMLGNRKPSKDEVRALSDRYWQQHDSGLAFPADQGYRQEPTRSEEIAQDYIDTVVNDIEAQFGPQPLLDKLFVIDGAFGAAGHITPAVFTRLGANILTVATHDGKINDGYGAADLSGLKRYLREHPDILGNPNFVGALANDGDGDRVMGVGATADGNMVVLDGNHIMEAIATSPDQPGIVGTLYTNSALRERLAQNSIGFEECDNGDSYVTRALKDKQDTGADWQRGGEFTGHIIDTNWLCSGDGVRTAAWFASLASTTGRSFGEIHEQMPMWPEVMSKVTLSKDKTINIQESKLVQNSLAQARELGARPIVRASGTEPIVRVWTEAPDEELAHLTNKLLHQSVANLKGE